MKRSMLYLAFAATGFSMQISNAQTDVEIIKSEKKAIPKSAEDDRRERKEFDIEALKYEKKQVTDIEKEVLKIEVERINKLVADNKITPDEAQVQKEKAAKNAALNIDNKTAILDNQIALAERDQNYNFKPHNGGTLALGIGNAYDDNGSMLLGLHFDNETQKPRFDKRTIGKVVLSSGFSNTIREGQSFNNSPYKWLRSRDSELGYVLRTRLHKDNNYMRLAYGLSFQVHTFTAFGNKYFTDSEGQTSLEAFPYHLKKQQFNVSSLVVPVHFEFGPSEKKVFPDRIRYSFDNWRIGLGGYAGINTRVMQRLKYDTGNNKIDDHLKRDYNINNVVYGLSTYVGIGPFSIYMKYDLNPLFKNAEQEQRVISAGFRLDL